MRCTSAEYDVDFKGGRKNGREVERGGFRDKLIGEMRVKPSALRLVVGYLVKDPPER